MIEPRNFNFNSAMLAISADAFATHYRSHYLKYVNNVNKLIPTYWDHFTIKQILNNCAIDSNLHNQAAQVWNHEFFFEQFTGNNQKPSTLLIKLIQDSGYEHFLDFCQDIIDAGKSIFGSGYVWVVQRFGTLRIITTQNAQNFIHHEYNNPILTIDMWEHSHYIDYFNDKENYIRNVLNTIDWSFIETRLCKK